MTATDGVTLAFPSCSFFSLILIVVCHLFVPSIAHLIATQNMSVRTETDQSNLATFLHSLRGNLFCFCPLVGRTGRLLPVCHLRVSRDKSKPIAFLSQMNLIIIWHRCLGLSHDPSSSRNRTSLQCNVYGRNSTRRYNSLPYCQNHQLISSILHKVSIIAFAFCFDSQAQLKHCSFYTPKSRTVFEYLWHVWHNALDFFWLHMLKKTGWHCLAWHWLHSVRASGR